MLGLFLAPGPALDTAVHLHAIGSWSFVLFAVSMVLFGVVRSTGAVIPPLVALFFALWVVRFPFAALLLPHWGADAIWWSFNLSAAVVAAVAIGYYRWGGWRRARMGPGRGAGPGATTAPAAEPAA
jgi:Na+-driven multidrug efflux pump